VEGGGGSLSPVSNGHMRSSDVAALRSTGQWVFNKFGDYL